MVSHINCLVEFENAISFSTGVCGRTTCTEKNSPCRATEAGLFSNVVYVDGHQIFRRIRRSKTFFRSDFGEEVFGKKVHFEIAMEIST